MAADTDEWEEEESLVLVELSGVIDYDMVTSADPAKCNILGADTDRPLLQLDRCVFVGEYEEAMGTLLMFEEVKDKTIVPTEENPEGKALKYAGKSFKHLLMKRAFVSEKTDSEGHQAGDGGIRQVSSHSESDPMKEGMSGAGDSGHANTEPTEMETG